MPPKRSRVGAQKGAKAGTSDPPVQNLDDARLVEAPPHSEDEKEDEKARTPTRLVETRIRVSSIL